MTTVPSFDDLLPIRLRFARARQINTQIAQIRDAYLATDPARLRNRRNESGQTEVILHLVREPSPALPYLAGESIHHVRAALDNLVLILAEHARGETLPDDEARNLQFPIAPTPVRSATRCAGDRSRASTASSSPRSARSNPSRATRSPAHRSPPTSTSCRSCRRCRTRTSTAASRSSPASSSSSRSASRRRSHWGLRQSRRSRIRRTPTATSSSP